MGIIVPFLGVFRGYVQLAHLRRVPAFPNPDTRLVNKSIPQINNIISEIGKATYRHWFIS